MTTLTPAQPSAAPQNEFWAQALARLRPGHALNREFYCEPHIFERERRRLLERHWHCAGHHSQVPEPGDFFTTELFGESLIIVRGSDREVRTLLNVCRHRGSRVCTEDSGRARGGFVCPYHAWNYTLDGSLRAAARMMPGFDRSAHALKRLHTAGHRGFDLHLFCRAAARAYLNRGSDACRLCARVRLGGRAGGAPRDLRPVRANWKLAVENYMECYHCGPAHAEYSRFHLYARPAAPLNHEADERVRQRARELGLAIGEASHWETRGTAGHEEAAACLRSLAGGRHHERQPGRQALGSPHGRNSPSTTAASRSLMSA